MDAKGSIVLAVVCIVVVAVGLFGFGVFNHGSRVDATGEHLRRIEDGQRELAARIESGAVRLGENQQRIATGQRILQEVRQREQTKDEKP